MTDRHESRKGFPLEVRVSLVEGDVDDLYRVFGKLESLLDKIIMAIMGLFITLTVGLVVQFVTG